MDAITEKKIEFVIQRDDIGPVEFSQLLFGPAGLFGTVWLSDADRVALVNGELYQRALARFHELEQAELTRLRQARATRQAKPDGAQQTPQVQEPQP